MEKIKSAPVLFKPFEVAEMLGVSIHTLSTWRCTQRQELPFVKIGSRVRYRFEDISEFLHKNTQNEE